MKGKRTYHSTQYRLLKTCDKLSLIIFVEMYKTTQVYPFIIIHNNSPPPRKRKKKEKIARSIPIKILSRKFIKYQIKYQKWQERFA